RGPPVGRCIRWHAHLPVLKRRDPPRERPSFAVPRLFASATAFGRRALTIPEVGPERRGDGGGLLVAGVVGDRRREVRSREFFRHHSGMLPCFLSGPDLRLLESISRSSIRTLRVSGGSITSSTNPRSA